MAGEDCAGVSPAALICSADRRQGWKDFPPKPSYPPAEQKSPPILTCCYFRDALHTETKDSRVGGENERGQERRGKQNKRREAKMGGTNSKKKDEEGS